MLSTISNKGSGNKKDDRRESTATRSKRFYSLLSVASVLATVVLWYLVTERGFISPKFLASPTEILHELRVLLEQGYTGTQLSAHILASLFRTFGGLFAAIVIGIPLGLLMGYNRTLASILSPIFSFIRPIPSIAFIPLVILWFGIGEFSKVIIIFISALLYVVLNCMEGVKSVPAVLIMAAQNLGVTRRQMFFDVILQAASPQIITGIKTAASISWALVVASELVGAQKGLGYIIMDASLFFRISDVYIGIILIGLIGLALEVLLNTLERRMLHWRGKGI